VWKKEWCQARRVACAPRAGVTWVVAMLMLSRATTLLAQHEGSDGRHESRHDDTEHCRVVCAPAVSLMPGVLRTHLRGGPLVRTIATNAEQRLPSSTDMEIIVATSARTALPRVSVFGSVQWLPNATARRNPFTLYTASEIGAPVRANAPTVTAGLSLALLPATETSGWCVRARSHGRLRRLASTISVQRYGAAASGTEPAREHRLRPRRGRLPRQQHGRRRHGAR
jgi:hypothetical protein